MEILHFYTAKKGVRFLVHTRNLLLESLGSESYRYYWEKNSFLGRLNRNRDEYDVAVITAHGSDDAILMPRPIAEREYHHSDYIKIMEVEDTEKFRNDFVCAVACSTALEFGRKAIENGTLAYMGYEIIIQPLFQVSDRGISKKVRETCEMAIKKAFTEEFADAFQHFIKDFQSVKMFRQNFSFKLEKRIIRFFKMSADEIYKVYGYKVDEGIWRKNRPRVQLLQLNFLKEVNRHLVCLGDEEYISAVGFRYSPVISEKTRHRLRNVCFKNKEYQAFFLNQLDEYLFKLQ